MKVFVNILVSALAAGTLCVGLGGCESSGGPDTGSLDRYFDEHPYVSDPRVNPGPASGEYAQEDITISPTSVEITYIGQEVVFTASEGEGPYTWDVADATVGAVRSIAWSQGIYTALDVERNNVIVYDKNGHAAIADLTIGTVQAFAVAANPTSLANDGDKSVLTATGGLEPYTWTVADPALGDVSSSTGSQIVYTRANQGDNSVDCTDNNGQTVVVVIQQP